MEAAWPYPTTTPYGVITQETVTWIFTAMIISSLTYDDDDDEF
jgi:hypothetical protein